MVSTITEQESSTYTLEGFTATIKAEGQINCIADGTVIFVGVSGDKFVVTVQHNSGECTRYGNIDIDPPQLNSKVYQGSSVGKVKRYCTFEYCTEWQGESLRPVRIFSKTYFKQNPSDVLDGRYVINQSQDTEVVVATDTVVTLTDMQKREFLYSRGDNIVEF